MPDIMPDVTWTEIGTTHLPEHLRPMFMAATEPARWREPNGNFPMSPGMALQAVIREFGLRGIAAVTYSETWCVNDTTFELPTGYEDPDFIGTYTILGIRTRLQDIWFLDMGVSITPIAVVTREVSA